MTRTLQINRTQLRALLILLAILPLLPTGVMIRYMFESVLEERENMNRELEKMTQRHVQALETRYAAGLPADLDGGTAEALATWARGELGEDSSVRVRDEEGKELAFTGAPAGRADEWRELRLGNPAWLVEWSRPLPGLFSEEFRQQTWQMIQVGAATFLLVSTIAFIAGREMTRRLELNEIRTDWLSQLAHELRTPVASLRGIADTLTGNPQVSGDPAVCREYYAMLGRETRRLWLVSEMFLWHSRLERQEGLRLRRETVALRPLLTDCAEEFRGQVMAQGGRLDLDTDSLGADFPKVLGDPEALRAILRNLLENAVKYCGERPPEITLGLRATAAEAVITVRDGGIGIDGGRHRQVFESFIQGDDKLSQRQGGCGLGLSIVKGLTEAHGGRVRLESAPGQGSTFTVTLPRLAD